MNSRVMQIATIPHYCAKFVAISVQNIEKLQKAKKKCAHYSSAAQLFMQAMICQ